ncbi:MAG: hypothetical protein IKG22_10475 [Atopobiaceae bacterium]|nr:hypothetical protein [Atopobiaceae bacterium]
MRKDVLVALALRLSRQNPDSPGTAPFGEGTTRSLVQQYLEGNRLISGRCLDGEPLFSYVYGDRPVRIPNEEHIAECRSAFKTAVRNYGRTGASPGQLAARSRKLFVRAKRALGAAKSSFLS